MDKEEIFVNIGAFISGLLIILTTMFHLSGQDPYEVCVMNGGGRACCQPACYKHGNCDYISCIDHGGGQACYAKFHK